jgi:hypothetical protein
MSKKPVNVAEKKRLFLQTVADLYHFFLLQIFCIKDTEVLSKLRVLIWTPIFSENKEAKVIKTNKQRKRAALKIN